MKTKTIEEIKARKEQAEGAICQAVFCQINALQHDTGVGVAKVEIELIDASTLDGRKRSACGCKITINV